MPGAVGSSSRSSPICLGFPRLLISNGPADRSNRVTRRQLGRVLEREHHRIRWETEEDAADRLVMRLPPELVERRHACRESGVRTAGLSKIASHQRCDRGC